ncbi:MAG: nicotinate-nucleotide adenylyltransferase [Bacilli bacterium]
MNIIIFGGDFNPIHNGHINMAKAALEQIDSSVLYFVPAVVSIWKEDSIPFTKKIEMIKLAISKYKNMKVSDYENTTGLKANYSIDTIKYFKKMFPNDNIYLLIGADQVNEFHRWKSADEIKELSQIIFFNRKGYKIDENNIKRFNIQTLKGNANNISSTDIRQLKSFEVPFEIVDYIHDNELYFIPKIKMYLSQDRFFHSLSVAKLAYQIAINNKIRNPGRAYIAGILHDIGKDINQKDTLSILNKYYIDYIDMPKFSYHQFVGTYIAKKDFNITNKSILLAIKNHATGNKNMNTIEKIVYSSDKIDPTRGYDSSKMIEECMKDYNSGFIFVLKENIKFLLENKKDINNKLTNACINYYIK